jgi:succinate dehydrogenase flavin-adding protein (antitoxin of CptAB toxin-antitoxin module)
MKELDLVLLRYLEGPWQVADAAQCALFEQLLDLPDPQLAAYLLGRETAPDRQLQGMVERLRAAAGAAVARAGTAGAGSGTQP